MMKRAACVLLSLLLWACEPGALPEPAILSVQPERVAAGALSSLSVRVNAQLPITVNYEEQSVDPAQLGMTVRLAGLNVDIPFAEPDGTLIVPVPEGLSLGAYDIQVVLADGRDAVREHAFSVVPAPALNGGPGDDGGTPSDGGVPKDGGPDDPRDDDRDGIRGFRIDPVGDQVRNLPFPIIIHAEGRDAKRFKGEVSVRANKGKVRTFIQGGFIGGVLLEEISLSHPGSGLYLLVEDSQGNRGLSNSFRVR